MKKQCTKCGIIKDLSEFSINKKGKHGRQPQCKECNKKYYLNNKEHIREVGEHYRKDNKERIKKRHKAYRENNKERIKEYSKEYRKTPNGKATGKRHIHKRRAHMKNTEVTLTAEEWEYILKKQKNKCNICGRKFTAKKPPARDHIIPITYNGAYSFDNIQALCRSCNSRKSAHLDKQFIQSWTLV